MRDIVFLFGAGASYGCGGVVPEQPPLGAQLYSCLRSSYPSSWGALPAHIKSQISTDFELGMQLIYDELGFAIPSLMREMAVYLIQFRPYKRSTLYDRLITELAKCDLLKRVLLSTLNYDCVLEFCLAEGSHPISYFDDAASDEIPVWKLHGSSNMFSHGVQAGQDVSYGTGVTWEGGIEAFLDPGVVIQKCLVETGLSPVMCLYMKGKVLHVSPSAIQSLQKSWAERILAASAIFCVGVRPVEGDSHIWDPLSKTSANLYFVGNQTELIEWAGKHREGVSEHLGNRFGSAYSSICDRIKKL